MNLEFILQGLQEQLLFLKEENKGLKEENKALKAENDRLKERLGLNFQNSSLPPSRDIYRLQRKNRVKSDQRPGGQMGHKPQGYHLKTPDEVMMFFLTLVCVAIPLRLAALTSKNKK